jgi:hypothetical protein
MKKKMQQLLAAMMAVAMLLSLSVTIADKVTELGASGGAKGTSKSEGPMPEDPVEVIFPTIPSNPGRGDRLSTSSGKDFSVYDIILDPHGLINATEGARYKDDNIKKTFSDSRLYFLKNFSEGEQRYDKESYPLKITNKGRQPINVNLSLDFIYDDSKVILLDEDDMDADKFTVTTGDDFSDSAGAQMYFTLKYGTVVSGDTTITGDTVVSGETVYVEKPAANAAPLVTVDGKGDYINSFTTSDDTVEWTWSVTSGDDFDALSNALKDIKVKLSYVKAEPTMSGGSLQNGAIKIETTGVPSAYTATVSGDDVITVSGDKVITDVTGATSSVTVGITKVTDPMATIAIDVLAPNAQKMKESTASGDDFSQVIHFKKPTTGAVASVMLDGNTDAYEQQWTDPQGRDVDPQGITATGYYWKLNAAKVDNKFPTLSFSMEGDINNDPMWDNVDTQNTGISFELIWDVMQHSTYYESVASGGQLEEVKVVLKGDKPTVTATTKPSSKSAKTLVLKWTDGSQDYSAYTPSNTVKLSSGTTLTMTASTTAKTLTNTDAWTAYNALPAGGTATVTFTADGMPDYEVEVALK